jgi:hypothetical protein
MAGVTIDSAIATFLQLRNKKSQLKAAYEKQEEELNAKMAKFEAWFIAKAQEQGVTSFKTAEGTAFLTNVDFANVADWDAVINFIKEKGTYDMLERRVSKRAIRAYIDEFKEVPAGITFGSRIDVNVRKPANKGDKADAE